MEQSEREPLKQPIIRSEVAASNDGIVESDSI